jgi:type IV secretory pathway VirB6-like protein
MLASAVATVAYGVLRHWDITFWFMMLLAAIGPLLLAAYLFDAVRRQDTSEPPTR